MLTTTPTNEIVSIKRALFIIYLQFVPKVMCLKLPVCLSQVGDEESREHLIKSHYMSRVAELTTQLQMSDSKAVHFHAEVSAIGALRF